MREARMKCLENLQKVKSWCIYTTTLERILAKISKN